MLVPQMAPITWLPIMITIIFSLLIIKTSTYFSPSTKTQLAITSQTILPMNWLW